MKPIINPWWIYFAEKCDILQTLLTILGFTILSLTLFVISAKGKLISKKLVIYGIIMIIIGLLLPSKSNVLEMVTFQYITPDNIELSGGTVKDTVDYITDSIDDILNDKK